MVIYELTLCYALAPFSLLIVGCATNEPQPTPAETQLEKEICVDGTKRRVAFRR